MQAIVMFEEMSLRLKKAIGYLAFYWPPSAYEKNTTTVGRKGHGNLVECVQLRLVVLHSATVSVF